MTDYSATGKIVPLRIGEKYGLSIREAGAYYGIGVKKLRRLAETHTGEFAIFMGNRYLILRPKFEEYLLNCMKTGKMEEVKDAETRA